LNITTKLVGLVLAIGVIAVSGNEARAQISVTVAGDWSETIDSSDLIAGAGSDLQSTYESAADAVLVSVSGTGGGADTWRMDVKKTDTSWHGSFVLSLRRTSSGTGGSVSGGDSYQQVTDSYNSFFSGSDDVSGIKVQLKLDGVSIQVPPDSYATTVYYTVVDT